MKRIVAFVVALVLLAGVVPVQAQGLLGGGYLPRSWDNWKYYFQGDQVHMLQADTVNWVGETMRIGQRANARYVAENLVQNGAFIGLNGPRGFYPLYQCGKGQRVGRYAADIGIGALIGAVVGGKKGAAIGGGLGAAVAVREDLKCWTVQNQMVVIDDPSDLEGDSSVPIRENRWNERLRQQRYGSQPQAPAPVELEWQMLRNEFQGVTIYARVQGLDPSQPIVISPGQTESVQISRGAQIWAEALVCLDENCTVRKWRQDVGRRSLPQGAGWVFHNPEEGR